MQEQDLPIACNLDALSSEERKQRSYLSSRIREHVIDISESKHGYRLCLKSDENLYRDALELILLERRCCPFLLMTLDFSSGEGPVYLDIGGSVESKAFLETTGMLGCADLQAGCCT